MYTGYRVHLFSAIVPENIAFHCSLISEVNIGDLHIEERELAQSFSHDKRREAFIAGRAAAGHAQRELTGHSAPVGRDQERYPIWPAGLIGSITHTDNTACAIVARDTEYVAIGIDIETLLPEGKGANISRRISTEKEYEWIHQDAKLSQMRTIQTFSAKEALFKALYPHYEKPFGFQAAELFWNESDSTFQAEILLPDLMESYKFLTVHMTHKNDAIGALVYVKK